MRIILMAHPSLGAKLLEALLKSGDEVVAVISPGADPLNSSPLKKLAAGAAIPLHEPSRMKDAGVYEAISSYRPDLGVLAFVQDIVPVTVLNLPRQGTIMYHPSLLPRHRGGSAINWTIIQGETRTGVSIIWPDAGIDTGPILLQKEADIAPDDTAGSLFFNKLYPMGIEALAESIRLIKEGRAPRLAQDESRATYEPLCTEERTVISWERPAAEVYNLIRGANPRPGAVTSLRGVRLKLFDSRPVPLAAGLPGEILPASEEGFTVACADGGVLVRQVQPVGSGKISAAEFAARAGLRPGDRLG